MRNYTFKIEFTDGTTVEQIAGNARSATILAQAERIHDAKSYDVKSVTQLD